MASDYNFGEIEKKWANAYVDFDGYRAVDFDKTREKKYVLVEFPYPSGSGLHVGHAFSMTGADVYARYMRMKGYNVLFPMGWDAFGLPTENYALRTGISPQKATRDNTAKFREQMDQLGFSFDWTREVNTTDPFFYKWTQWIFVKLFEKGLAEKQEMPINWCPKCKIGLANEEVIDGSCERCGTGVERRTISQWVVKITKYADRLIEGLKQTDFIEKVKAAQINWIGKKEGLIIDFEVENSDRKIQCFTKFPETIYGTGWVVVSPEYPNLGSLVTIEQKASVDEYIEFSKKKSEFERISGISEKTGVFTGSYALNPVNGKQIPIWIGDYVLANFGTGAVMGVALHDNRDYLFAKKYQLEMIQVEVPSGDPDYIVDSVEKVIEDGVMINSDQFNGMTARSGAYKAISDFLVEKGWAKRKTEYHLRDWIFSRQHYWGEPVPMIYCEKDGWQTVPEDQLPIQLPKVEKYQPTGSGESPLANIKEFVETTCPKCGGRARRETDTMPNWAGSDWYFLRYLDPTNGKNLADMEKMNYWLPVDIYVGGDEHNTLHLLYSRFIYQFMWDLGVVPKDKPEPYQKRLSHGVILAPDGNRMSKTRGNVIIPEDVTKKFGADATRMYFMFMGPFDATMAWSENGLLGVRRFIERLYRLVIEGVAKGEKSDEESFGIVNKLVKKIDSDLSVMKFNTAIAAAMGALNGLTGDGRKVGTTELKKMVAALAVFAPFVAEEMWQMLGGEFSVHIQKWPVAEKIIENEVTMAVQVNGRTRGTLQVESKKSKGESEVKELALADPKIGKYVVGKRYKVIFVPGKIINFVMK